LSTFSLVVFLTWLSKVRITIERGRLAQPDRIKIPHLGGRGIKKKSRTCDQIELSFEVLRNLHKGDSEKRLDWASGKIATDRFDVVQSAGTSFSFKLFLAVVGIFVNGSFGTRHIYPSQAKGVEHN
jgi:hypothetical protein